MATLTSRARHIPCALWAARLLLLVLCWLAYALRVYALGRQDLWGDEAVSALVLKHTAAQILAGQVDPFHPPLYFLLLRLWTGLAGGSEFAIRYLSLMGMMLGVAWSGRAAWQAYDRPTARWTLWLAASAPFLIYYAQEARMYGVAMAFNAGALWAVLTTVRRAQVSTTRHAPGWGHVWLAFAALGLGAVYAHYLSFLHLLGIALGLGLAWRTQWRRLVMAALTALGMGLVYLPWALIQMNRTRGQFPFRPEVWTLTELGRVSRDTLQAFSTGQMLSSSWSWPVTGLMVGLAAIGVIMAVRSRQPAQWLPGIVVLTVLLVGWAFSAYLFAFEPRYLMMGMPAYLLLVASGVRQVARRWPAIAGVLLILILLTASLANYTYYTSYSKGNYGKLMRLVAGRAQPGDVLLLNNPLQRALFEYYQPEGIDYYYLSRDSIVAPDRLEADMTQFTAGRSRAWLVMFGNPAEYDPQFRVENWLATRGAKSYYEGFGDSTLSLYVLSGTSAVGATVPVTVTFGHQIRLTGYRLSAGTVRPGDTLIVELDWQAVTAPARDYTIFVQLLGPDGILLAQVDTQPVGGTRPTSHWTAGETISDRYALQIPAQVPDGEGQLVTGLYPWPEITRLPVTEAGGWPVDHDAVRLTGITLTSTYP